MATLITVLSLVGFYVSAYMYLKTLRAQRGELEEPSIVETPRARLLGFPNTLLALPYYPLLVALVWGWHAVHAPELLWLAFFASAAAALMSIVLAYSLLFVTKRDCPYCWTAHVTNLALFICTALVLTVER